MYEAFSADYDRFVNWPARLAAELPFIERAIAQADSLRYVLDAACGTGMHAVALARQGWQVTGADLSPEMIARAQANAQAAGVEVRSLLFILGSIFGFIISGAAGLTQANVGLEEGIPEMEIKRLCDVHVAVFRESLEAQVPPESLPGHLVHTFRAENRAAAQALDRLQEAIEALKADPTAPDRLAAARERLRELREYEKHYRRKENFLFPYLERKGFTGPSTVMWAIHDDIRGGWKALAALLEAGPGDDPEDFRARIEGVFGPMATAVREMFLRRRTSSSPPRSSC